jgi:hypothetical protein
MLLVLTQEELHAWKNVFGGWERGGGVRTKRRKLLLPSRVEPYKPTFVVLFPYLQSVHGTQFINTRRLNQDILENLFSHVRVFEHSFSLLWGFLQETLKILHHYVDHPKLVLDLY